MHTQEENAKLMSLTAASPPCQGLSDLFMSVLDDLLEGYEPAEEELQMVRQMVECATLTSTQQASGLPPDLASVEVRQHPVSFPPFSSLFSRSEV